MSSNKKSLSSLLLLLLLFFGIASASWFYFTKDKQESGAESEETALLDNAASQENTEEPHNENTAHTHDGHGSSAQKGNIHDLSVKPTLGRRGVGDPNAPVQIQEFFSLTCNHCADFHAGAYQALKERFIDTGKVYFIFEEFPLNGPALYGSMIARCMPEERYEPFISLLLKNQETWAFGGDFKKGLKQNAKLAGMSDESFDACFANKELQKEIAQNIAEASDAWKISSTPSFVVNKGERLLNGSQSIENFEKVINELIGNTASTNSVEEAPLEPSETQKDIWKKMEAGTYDPETFEPATEAVQDLEKKTIEAVGDKLDGIQ